MWPMAALKKVNTAYHIACDSFGTPTQKAARTHR